MLGIYIVIWIVLILSDVLSAKFWVFMVGLLVLSIVALFRSCIDDERKRNGGSQNKNSKEN